MGFHDLELMDGKSIDQGGAGALGVFVAGCEGADATVIHSGACGCLIPQFGGAHLAQELKKTLRDRFVTEGHDQVGGMPLMRWIAPFVGLRRKRARSTSASA